MLSLRDALTDISQQHLTRACCEMSRRDGAIVAWHEVPSPLRGSPFGFGAGLSGRMTGAKHIPTLGDALLATSGQGLRRSRVDGELRLKFAQGFRKRRASHSITLMLVVCSNNRISTS